MLSLAEIADFTWNRPIGLGWQHPYTVRYASNLDDGPWHGMPLGGLGAGCIGRSHQGDFNLWHIDGGEHIFQTLPACQFSLFEQAQDQQGRAYALCSQSPQDGRLRAWQWYPKTPVKNNVSSIDEQQYSSQGTGTYYALYPRSEFVYRNVFQADLNCQQFSPIWAENYRETSYPIAVFFWSVHNPTDHPLTLSILLSWHNSVGWFTNALKSPQVKLREDGSPVYDYQPQWGNSQGNFNQWRTQQPFAGCVLRRQRSPLSQFETALPAPAEGDGEWAIATRLDHPGDQIFYHTHWNPVGDGADLWHSFAQDGTLPNINDETPAAVGEQSGAAIALRFILRPGETRQIPFVVAWDFPVTEFAEGVVYFRRYTDFFGRSGNNAWAIAQTALQHYREWQQQIHQWQQPMLQQELPSWFKMALFNELYVLTDGGTLWSAASDRDPIGQFAVLECLDYRWYESLDVRLYGSFALLILFPELDKAVLRAFARAIPTADATPRVIGYYYTQGVPSPTAVRKVANATPHDLGAPNEHPWEKTNYTSYQDCNLWKDLGSDFVLQVYRDFVLTGRTDVTFLQACWPAIVATLTYLKTFDQDGDGIPENSGAPDQTFDDWRLQGISAYCGGLWLAALEAAIAIGQAIEESISFADVSLKEWKSDVAIFQNWLEAAKPLYHNKLWNGQYYRLDTGSGSDVVMADQLCGQFYARLLGLADIVPLEKARSALKTIYDACFLKFHAGQFGAANGVRPDGSPVNPTDTHPLEVWTGINFGLAAFMIQMGMKDEAFCLIEAVVHQIYENGLQFRTPEAITAQGTFRASHYLRAMAIWAIYHVSL